MIFSWFEGATTGVIFEFLTIGADLTGIEVVAEAVFTWFTVEIEAVLTGFTLDNGSMSGDIVFSILIEDPLAPRISTLAVLSLLLGGLPLFFTTFWVGVYAYGVPSYSSWKVLNGLGS